MGANTDLDRGRVFRIVTVAFDCEHDYSLSTVHVFKKKDDG
jgi:hypothetical protein